ncbi:MAG: 3-methylornithine--L-lysine ligase PylC [Desulfobacter sp.]
MSLTIAIVGGKLQGCEAAYLAGKAGFRTLVVDQNPDAPASGLCDVLVPFRFTDRSDFPVLPETPDLILPAVEDDQVLACVDAWARRENIPLAFDMDAYETSVSKLASDRLFRELGLPVPAYWPDCGLPVVVKPDRASGSEGVEIFHDQQAFARRFPDKKDLAGRVAQAYLEGPSFSIEVMGAPGQYQTYLVTDLGMDEAYDCNRVTAPTALADRHIRAMEEMAVNIAEAVSLKGIMDLEVILNGDELYILEVDARLPSQTPMAVYHATGLNMVAALAANALGQEVLPMPGQQRHTRVEHIRVDGPDIAFLGEHIMSTQGSLHLEPGFFGADEAVTSYSPGKRQWVATLIFTGATAGETGKKRDLCLDNILNNARKPGKNTQ